MGLYRATINQPEARVGKTVRLNDADRLVQLRVASGYLVPVDDVAINFQNELVVVEAPAISSKDAIKAAIEEARAKAAAEGKDAKPSVTSFGFAPDADTHLPSKDADKGDD